MARDISLNLKFSSNGSSLLAELSKSAENLTKKINQVNHISFKETIATMSAITVTTKGLIESLQGLTEPAMSLDKAMRSANTMAGKGREDFEKLKQEVKSLTYEIPIARDLLANGLYQTISNGVPEDNWIEYLRTSVRSAVGGMASLEEVVKVTSTVIKNYGLSWVMEERL